MAFRNRSAGVRVERKRKTYSVQGYRGDQILKVTVSAFSHGHAREVALHRYRMSTLMDVEVQELRAA